MHTLFVFMDKHVYLSVRLCPMLIGEDQCCGCSRGTIIGLSLMMYDANVEGFPTRYKRISTIESLNEVACLR